ncbi:MAG: AAA family ATPase, partial [Candidatus Methylumidiphilus sp.]
WLDENEIVPGQTWQVALERVIQTTHAAIVLVGKDGLGPWEYPEIRACLSEFVSRKLPVIPVLLPGAPREPDLPLFLKTLTWVDMRKGLNKEALDKLTWGITGSRSPLPEKREVGTFASLGIVDKNIEKPHALNRQQNSINNIKLIIKNASITSETQYGFDTLWGDKNGWFSCGFGPFRRFIGGNSDLRTLYYSHPKLARHLSVFGEDVALTEAMVWLRDLKFKQLELYSGRNKNTLFDKIKNFVNQDGFLPFGAKLQEVTSEQIVFLDGNDTPIPMLELSDGYRSVLSLTFELIRLMHSCLQNHELFNSEGTEVIVPGVVLIDEVDVHLHPNWQRSIGPWLCRHFPKVQFIVTTHSPFVCQQATSVWKLPDPGSDEDFKRVQGEELTRLLYGDATLALETSAFGLEQNRSDKANELLDELAALNLKASSGQLNDQEANRHKELKTLLQPVLP